MKKMLGVANIEGKTDWPTFIRGGITGGAFAIALLQSWPHTPFYPQERATADEVKVLVGSFEGETQERIAHAVSTLARTAVLVERTHVERDLTQDTLSRMIDGALSRLDPYSGFMSEKLATDLTSKEDHDHRRQIGIIVSPSEGRYRIEAVAPGGPAERAGLRAGDEVVRVDGKFVGNETVYAINEMLREALADEARERIDIGLRRPGISSILNVVIEPADIAPVHVFDLGVHHGVLHLYLDGFYPGLAADADALIARAIQNQGIKGVVLDLRNNGGGLTDEAVALAELFLPAQSLLYEMSGRMEGIQQVRTNAVPRYGDLGVSVIVNGNSASASEIVAGALQAHDRAQVVGWPSLGKGTVQRVFPMDGGAVTLTFAEYRDGGLRKINGVGVMPNIAMDAPDPKMRPSRFDKDSARAAAIRAALTGGLPEEPDPEAPTDDPKD